MSKTQYDSVFVSDVHLGTPRCNVKKLLEFLKTLNTKKLVLVGDIIDFYCLERYGTKWTRQHMQCIHQIIKLLNDGTEVIYILGNHESQIRRYSGFEHKNFKIVDEYLHEDNRGGKFICVHGDNFSQFSSGSWKQLLFNKGYEIITPLSFWLEKFFNFSLVYFLKNTMRGRNYINQYETDVVSNVIAKDWNISKNLNGVICGHIHHANMRQFGIYHYICCGDWCDTCSAIVEKNGFYSLEKYKND